MWITHIRIVLYTCSSINLLLSKYVYKIKLGGGMKKICLYIILLVFRHEHVVWYSTLGLNLFVFRVLCICTVLFFICWEKQHWNVCLRSQSLIPPQRLLPITLHEMETSTKDYTLCSANLDEQRLPAHDRISSSLYGALNPLPMTSLLFNHCMGHSHHKLLESDCFFLYFLSLCHG